jgi:hypothetical protein
MTKTPKAVLLVLVVSAALAIAITGCAPAVSSVVGGVTKPQTSTSSHAAIEPQGKLNGVPKKCPSIDAISISMGQLFHGVHPTVIKASLVCQYYVDLSGSSPFVEINFEPISAAAAPQWKSHVLAAQPLAKSVDGTAEAAIAFTTAEYGEFEFLSGTTVCNITASPQFDEAKLAALAYQILD